MKETSEKLGTNLKQLLSLFRNDVFNLSEHVLSDVYMYMHTDVQHPQRQEEGFDAQGTEATYWWCEPTCGY